MTQDQTTIIIRLCLVLFDGKDIVPFSIDIVIDVHVQKFFN